jgi:ATP-dependent Lhr-like helicase
VIFRRLIERESFRVSWLELLRVYRRLEARGEIRGGYFVSGVSGEQFALPEAIGSVRSLRKRASAEGKEPHLLASQMITISGADPLNLAGILVPVRVAPSRHTAFSCAMESPSPR